MTEQHAKRFYVNGVFEAASLSDELIELTGNSKTKGKIDLQAFITALKIDHTEQWAVFFA